MYAHVVNVLGEAKPSPWAIQFENLGKSKEDASVCFLSEKSGTISQKVRVGGHKAFYPEDVNFDINDVSYEDETNENGIATQTIRLPFDKISVNGSNLNPTFVEYTSNQLTQHGVVVFTMDNSYRYVRSYVDHDVAEIISTFRGKSSIGCILKLNARIIDNTLTDTDKNSYPVLMVDTFHNGKYCHIRVNVVQTENGNRVKVTTSIVKNKEVIKKLQKINTDLEKKVGSRRFLRNSETFITSTIIVPMSMTAEEVDIIIDRHGLSDALNTDKIVCVQVNVDDDGFIIADEWFKNVQENLIKNKTKAITLVNCKCKTSAFTLKPLYIFICNETEKVSEKNVKMIRCLKTN